MKKAPLMVLVILAGMFLLIEPAVAHANPTVDYSTQAGALAGSGNTQISFLLQTTAGTQIIIAWMEANVQGQMNPVTAVLDNQSNSFSTVAVPVGSMPLISTCAASEVGCNWGAQLSLNDTHTGHDFITITFFGNGYFVGLGAYDVAPGHGKTLYYNSQSPGNSNTASSSLAVTSYTPTSGALVVTSAFVNTGASNNTFSAGAGYALASNQPLHTGQPFWTTSEYGVVTTPTTSPETTGRTNVGWTEESIAFVAQTFVTQPINLAVANFGPFGSVAAGTAFGISGCGVSNSSLLADSYKHTYSGLTPSCLITVETPNFIPGARDRYAFDDAGSLQIYWNIMTPASGTGNVAANTTYYQLLNSFSVVPQSPNAWDSAYSEPIIGTYLGTASSTLVTATLANQGGTFVSTAWSDWGQLITFPSSFASTGICGGAWTAQAPNTFNLKAAGSMAVYYDLGGCSITTTITTTVIGINGPSPAGFANALAPEFIPLFVLAIGMMIVWMLRIRGDFGVTVMLGFFFVGNLIGMLNNGVNTNGFVPFALTAESGVFFVMWIAAGGTT